MNYLLKDLSHTDRTAVEKLFLEMCDLYNFISMKEKSHKLKYLMDKQGNPMDSEKNTKQSRPGLQSRTKWRRKKKAQLKQNVSVVFNLSTVPLSDAMISLLNKGLGFCVKP